ncbi:MAG: CpsD/CapB family tyrosine-protein kinase [Syntrophobacteraceae bacterium]|jgi:Mrp family chromosome partitioning ATPase
MSKIYEALEQAYRARAGSDKLVTVPHMSKIFTDQPQINVEEEMLCLYNNIDSLLPNIDKRIIQFIGSRQGEGTSTIVREFAKMAATLIGKSVLLLDANRVHPSHHVYFNFETDHGWQEAIMDKDLAEKVFHQVDQSLLYVGRSSNSASFTPEIFDSPKFQSFQEMIWERFDLVLVDSPPLKSSPDGLAMAPKTTGIVLVVEAESTGWRVIQGTINKIKQVGGNILGVVLNKRRYYIPEFIYKRL